MSWVGLVTTLILRLLGPGIGFYCELLVYLLVKIFLCRHALGVTQDKALIENKNIAELC